MRTSNRGKPGMAARRTALSAVAAVAAALLLAACAPEGGEAPDRAMAAARQKIIVEFSLPEGREEAAAAAGRAADPPPEAAANRILSRLAPEARQSARTFDRLPLIALEADAATMMQLVRMPEVVSIRADREMPVPAPPADVPVPNVPSGGKAR